MVLFRIRLVLTARVKPLSATVSLSCRREQHGGGATRHRQSRNVRRRYDQWRAIIYDARFESGPESAHLAFAATTRECAALLQHPGRRASSPGAEARSSQHGSGGTDTNSRLPCARSFPCDTAPSSGFERRLSRPQTRRRGLCMPTCEARPVRNQYRSDTGSPSPESIASRE
jgi:hypothetical protein